MNARNPRFVLLDSLRAIAAPSVCAYHVTFYARSLGSTLGPWLGHLNMGLEPDAAPRVRLTVSTGAGR